MLIEQNSIQIEIPMPAYRILTNNKSMSAALVLSILHLHVGEEMSKLRPIFLMESEACLLFDLQKKFRKKVKYEECRLSQ